ncbi:hypothetical protein [Leptotrichia trevisanii]|nr:hypothetical protein [Leptotrichia trevisanii]
MKKDRKEVIMGDIMLVVIDKEIEAGMEIRKIDDDNHYVKMEKGYKGFFLRVDEIKGVYYDNEENNLLCKLKVSFMCNKF